MVVILYAHVLASICPRDEKSIFIGMMLGLSLAGVVLGTVLLFIAAATSMLLHRAAWPMLSRLLYNLPRHRVVENKKALYGMAATLLLVSVTGSYSWQALRKFVLGW